MKYIFDFSFLSIILYFGRVEQSVYALLRTRDMAISRYREFGIPVDWLLDSGVVGKVCFKTQGKSSILVDCEVGSKMLLEFFFLQDVIWILEVAMFRLHDVIVQGNSLPMCNQ
jgi:hypothetical protein